MSPPQDLQLTSVLRAVGAGRGRVPDPPPVGPYLRLPGDLADVGTAEVHELARRAGHPGHVADALAVALAGLTRPEVAQVVDPLGRRSPGTAGPRPVELGGAHAVQVDQTTCGSAVLAMLALAGDPVLALWAVTGESLVGGWPAELGRPPAPEGSGAVRFALLQRRVKKLSNRGALGLGPWPGGLGTPPWGAARAARYADVGYTHRIVDDRSRIDATYVLRMAARAAAAGVPVPLFTGGDLERGVSTAVPRHVVLLSHADLDTGRCAVYEPSSGAVHPVALDDLVGGVRPGSEPSPTRRALGGWSHVCWAVLPAGTRRDAR